MYLKLIILALAIWAKDNSATVHDISLELASSSKSLPDNVLRKSDLKKLPLAYILQQTHIPKARIGKGMRSRSPLKAITGKHKSNVYNGLKNKFNKAEDRIVHKITPVEVILDVEVGDKKERDEIEKLLSNRFSTFTLENKIYDQIKNGF